MKVSRLVATAALLASGCKGNPGPAPTKDSPPAASSVVTSVVASAATPAHEAAPEPVPTLYADPFTAPGTQRIELFPIEGALAVAEQQRVGRIAGDGVEWLDAKMPTQAGALGSTVIYAVHGRWPDRVDVFYTNTGGRVPAPTYFPLTGKGTDVVFGGGGAQAWIAGAATVGESTILAGYSYIDGVGLHTVRGPKLKRRMLSPREAGCKDTGHEWPQILEPAAQPAVMPMTFGGTRDGTLISIGPLCGHGTTAAEIWGKDGTSRIVDISRWMKGSGAGVVQGKGDELWVVPSGTDPILHYQDGNFDPLPTFDKIKVAFLSAGGQLHASDGETIQRWADGKWTIAARFAWPMPVHTMALENDTFWVDTDAIYQLRKGPDLEMHDGCATPFVYLYDVSRDNAKDFTFPTTRKALSTFPEVADIGLVEIQEGGRRLGVTVKDRAQGEALVAHVKATMPKETPRLICYSPSNPRRIEPSAPRK